MIPEAVLALAIAGPLTQEEAQWVERVKMYWDVERVCYLERHGDVTLLVGSSRFHDGIEAFTIIVCATGHRGPVFCDLPHFEVSYSALDKAVDDGRLALRQRAVKVF